MSLSIHTNFASLVTQNTLSKNNNALSTAMQRLGTGLRVNSAADDAAGLQIANRLTAQTRGMAVAQRNAQDAIGLLQTADGALDEISQIAFRMKDLALQAANGTNSDDDKAALDAEYQQLVAEITRITTDTTYGTDKLFTDGFIAKGMTFQIGASADETLEIEADDLALDGITGADALSGDLTTGASAAITSVDELLKAVGTTRAVLGANINRLDHTINNLASVSQNTEAAKGRIMDTDFAAESSNMTKQQMLMQSGISVLGNSNQLTGLVASLLR